MLFPKRERQSYPIRAFIASFDPKGGERHLTRKALLPACETAKAAQKSPALTFLRQGLYGPRRHSGQRSGASLFGSRSVNRCEPDCKRLSNTAESANF